MQFNVFAGIIEDVFYDKENHNAKTLKIKNDKGVRSFYLDFDQSGLFNFLAKGDSVIKNYKDYDVYVYRNKELK